MRRNHHSLAESLNLKNIIDNPECTFCGHESQDLNHIIWNCPLLEHYRKIITYKLIHRKYYPPYNIESFITDPNIPAFQIILKFSNNSKINV